MPMTPEQVSVCILSLEESFCNMRDELEPFLESELSPQVTKVHLLRAKEHFDCLWVRANELATFFEGI